MKPFSIGVLAFAGRILVGGVLTAAAVSKLSALPQEFAALIEAYDVLPPTITIYVARVLPWLELAAGLSLLLGIALKWSSLASSALFLGFVAVLASTFWRGINLENCGCFGSWGPELKPSQTIFMDGTLFCLSLLVFFDREKLFSLDRRLSQSL